MKLPELYRVRREDVPEAPSWFTDKFLQLYNKFSEFIYIGLDKGVTYSENIDVQYIEIETRRLNGVNEINPNNPYTFVSNLRNSIPVGVTVMQCIKTNVGNHQALTGAVGVDWDVADGVISIYEIYNMEVDPLATEERFLLRLKVE